MEKIISRILIVWMLLIFISIFCLYNKMDNETQQFYTFGPSDNLVVFGLIFYLSLLLAKRPTY